MCAEYNLKTSERDLSQLLRSPLLNNAGQDQWDQHTRLFTKAPVILMRDGHLQIEEMSFSMLPPGGRIPFSANTRLDDWDERQNRVTYAYERPTWRESFLQRRCVVPVSEFLEPIYRGDYAGQMMGFFSPSSPLLLVAGIFQETVDSKSGEVFSGFSLITDFAHPFVREVGHHRTIVTLAPEQALIWIQEKPVTGEWGVRFLLEHKQRLDLDTKPMRTMKNWKARVKNSENKRLAEERIRPKVEESRQRLLQTKVD